MIVLVAALGLALACALWALLQAAGPADGGDAAACRGCALPKEASGPPARRTREDDPPRPLTRLSSRQRRRAARFPLIGAWLVLALLVALALTACPKARSRQVSESETRTAMGTAFIITVVAEESAQGRAAIEAAFEEIERLEELLSEWRAESEISRLNAGGARAPVPVGPELRDVVEQSLEISKLTGGAFDITVAACWSLWSFSEPRIPGQQELESCLERVGWTSVELDKENSTIRFAKEGMRLGISGIGKGYGIDAAARVLESRGITDYIVDGGGDVRLRGRNVDRPWRVGIAHPRQPGTLFADIEVAGGAIVTSGDYMQFFEQGGVRYHHILDPATGRPAVRSIAVTVMAESATRADALATGLFVLGPEKGLALAERLEGVEALIFGPDASPVTTSGIPAP